MKAYNKLVRDNIEDIMINKGLKPITRILSEEEFAAKKAELLLKL